MPRALLVTAAAFLALALPACDDDGPTSDSSTTASTPTTSASTTSTTTTTTTEGSTTSPGPGAPDEERAIAQGVLATLAGELDLTPDQFRVTDVRIASADPTWASARLVPEPELTLDPLYVVLHQQEGVWAVVDFGTSGVGCVGPPPEVVAEIGLDCS